MTEPAQPVTVFGIPAKPLVFFATIAIIVLTDVDYHRITETYEQLSTNRNTPAMPDQSTADTPRDIVVTPEMVDRARREIETTRQAERERGDSPTPADRFYYIIELHSGGDLESVEMTIHPDQVILVSASGVKTVIPRQAIKRINRIKLPPESP
ncbi:MAG: hypothetical protein IH612_10030 [Desulfofustis sp.]|nr:hypothetical protein [Desulfofustis sp.]